MGQSFTQKLINVAVALATNTGTNQPNTFAEGAFSGGGNNQVTLSGSRTSVRVYNSGAAVGCNAEVRIWGLTPSLMNQLNTLGIVYNIVPKNQLTITAGDAINGMASVFSGTIQSAYGDYEHMPDVPMIFWCNPLLDQAAIPVPVSSFQGSTDVATIMSGLARQMGWGFENNGVSLTLSNPYFSGTLRDQVKACADAAGIKWGFVNGNTLSIWPDGGNRTTTNIPTISKATGMVTSPTLTQQGIVVRTLFNPLIAMGGLIEVQSNVLTGVLTAQQSSNPTFNAPTATPTGGSIWAVYKLDLALDSLVRDGQWLATAYAYNPGYPRPLTPSTGS